MVDTSWLVVGSEQTLCLQVGINIALNGAASVPPGADTPTQQPRIIWEHAQLCGNLGPGLGGLVGTQHLHGACFSSHWYPGPAELSSPGAPLSVVNQMWS